MCEKLGGGRCEFAGGSGRGFGFDLVCYFGVDFFCVVFAEDVRCEWALGMGWIHLLVGGVGCE